MRRFAAFFPFLLQENRCRIFFSLSVPSMHTPSLGTGDDGRHSALPPPHVLTFIGDSRFGLVVPSFTSS